MTRTTLVSMLMALAGLASQPASAQEAASADSTTKATATRAERSRFYYGGSVSLNISTEYSRISLVPQAGIKLTPKLSIGSRLRYEYLNDRRRSADRGSHNYGGSLFSRYRFIPRLYGHAEYSYMSYDYFDGRRGVPFLLVGAGYTQPMGEYASFYAEVLFDLLDDEDSPYSWEEPRFNFGINLGY